MAGMDPGGATGGFGDPRGPAAAVALPEGGAPVPHFHGEHALDLVNQWAVRVDQRLAALAQGVESARGGAAVSLTQLQTEVQALEVKVMGNLQHVADVGLAALKKTIDDFKIELGKHEFYHQQARSGIEQVVAQAAVKFQELEARLLDEQRRTRDAFTMLEARVGSMRGDGSAAPAATSATATTLPTSSGADPLQAPGADAWAQAAAASHGRQPDAPPGMTAQTHCSPKPFSINNRDWGDNRRLDLVGTPDAYLTWRDRALGHVAKDRPDVRRLLLWAERQSNFIDAVAENAGAVEAGLMDRVADVSYALFEAIKFTLHDNLLNRARTCDGRGLELWRRLHSEWEGAAPNVVAAKARRYQDPVRCNSVLKLWEALPAWEQLGAEVVEGGILCPIGCGQTPSRSSSPTTCCALSLGGLSYPIMPLRWNG